MLNGATSVQKSGKVNRISNQTVLHFGQCRHCLIPYTIYCPIRSMFDHLWRPIPYNCSVTFDQARKNVREACAALFFIILLQTVAYQILWDMKFLARNLALCGAVCLLLAEVTGETRTIFAGVPTLDDNTPKNYLQLSGIHTVTSIV